MVHRRELNGQELVLGNHGALFGNAMTWWDHGTGSVWSQPTGEAILGPRKGDRLEVLASTLTSWEEWTAEHPETLALDVRSWAAGFHLETMAIALDRGDAKAWAFLDVAEAGVVNDVVGGVPVAVVVDPEELGRWVVFSRSLDDRVVELAWEDGGLVDRTGVRYDARSGRSEAGDALDVLPAFTIFPDDFPVHFPGGELWSP